MRENGQVDTLDAGARGEEDAHRRRLLLEIALIILVVAASYVLGASFDIYEKFHLWTRGYEEYNLDEAPIIIFTLALCLVWFAYRRWSEYRREAEARRRLEEEAAHIRKMEAVGQLTGGIAHDFSNLLTIVQGNLELLDDDALPPEMREEMLGEALAASGRGSELCQRLLTFARRQPLQPRPIDLNHLLGGLTGLLRRTLGAAIGIETVTGDSLWFAVADPLQVENAILNLALNARDAMPRGGTLRIETANVRIDADFAAAHPDARAGEYILLTVSDDGSGMPPEVKARAFEPFFTTKPPGKGTGLGLSMVYGFARQSGGHLRIESAPGRGTRVSLYLPRTEEAPEAEPAEADYPAKARGSGRILVVEDDPGVRRHAVRVLKSLGYTAIEAEGAEAALAVLDGDEEIDLLFTDILMPGGMDGWELAEKARERRPDLKVLFTSANPEHALENGKAGCQPPGGVDLLRKPYRRREIARRVRLALSS